MLKIFSIRMNANDDYGIRVTRPWYRKKCSEMVRLSYVLQRVREAGLRMVIAKARQRLLPYLYWPIYALARRFGGKRGGVACEEFLAIGAVVREAFHEQWSKDPSYPERVRARVEDVLSGKISVLGFGRTDAPSGSGWRRDTFHSYE